MARPGCREPQVESDFPRQKLGVCGLGMAEWTPRLVDQSTRIVLEMPTNEDALNWLVGPAVAILGTLLNLTFFIYWTKTTESS
jgi:hypothetical protein